MTPIIVALVTGLTQRDIERLWKFYRLIVTNPLPSPEMSVRLVNSYFPDFLMAHRASLARAVKQTLEERLALATLQQIKTKQQNANN